MTRADHLEAHELLAIDVAAELRTVSRAQLQGAWQLPAELVRFAVRCGAERVRVSLSRGCFVLAMDGAGIPIDDLQHLQLALDPDTPLGRRHRAIVALERADAQALLWVAGHDRVRLRIVSQTMAAGAELRWRDGGSPALQNAGVDGPSARAEVEVRSPTFDHVRASSWLHTACRFAPIELTSGDGAALGGLDGALFRMAIAEPLPGWLLVTASGEAPRLWLLRHGVLVTRCTVPGWPAFDAALEMAHLTHPGASPAQLREAVTPHLGDVIEQAVLMLVKLGRRLPELSAVARSRVLSLLLRVARRGLGGDEIRRLQIVPMREAGATTASHISLDRLTRLGVEQGGRLFAREPESTARRMPVAVLEVTADERALLGEFAAVRFEAPPQEAPRQQSMARVGRGLASRLSRWLRNVAAAAPSVLPDGELADDERQLLLAGNQATAGDLELVFVTGCGSIRSEGRGRRLLLPRHNPKVQRAVAGAADSRWLYPALLTLVGEVGLDADELRASWFRRTVAAFCEGAAGGGRAAAENTPGDGSSR